MRRLKSFWDQMGSFVLKTAKTSALFIGVAAGILFYAYVFLWLKFSGHKEMPFERYLFALGIGVVATFFAALLSTLATAVRFWKKSRIPYALVVDEGGHFKPCPRCGGTITQWIGGGCLPMAGDPSCGKCAAIYQLRPRTLLEDEFAVTLPTA